MTDASGMTSELLAATAVCRQDVVSMGSMRASCRTCTRGGGDREKTGRTFIEAIRCCRHIHFLLSFTLRLLVVLSVLRPAGAGVRQQYVDVASRTIQSDVVLEGQVDRVMMSDPAPVMVVRVLTVYKGRRLRRQAAAVSATGLRLTVDLSSLVETLSAEKEVTKDDDEVIARRVTSPTSFTRGARLFVFLRHRDHDVNSAGRRRRRDVDLYRLFTSPAAVTESVRRTVEKYSKRRNGKYTCKYTAMKCSVDQN